ncbi:hypothetical protein AMQ84_00080 [Paenibacillus riograndensis]|uniref:Uncharacterized protein n=1 Tax=Paenibacillus riograndensis TaxID=483937 RepID=A0A132UCK4_9BACL|nr:hypothetical protein AMQ84_00080 [Paenibacillus riograndensis]
MAVRAVIPGKREGMMKNIQHGHRPWRLLAWQGGLERGPVRREEMRRFMPLSAAIIIKEQRLAAIK